MNTPCLPNLARSILKGTIMAIADAGVITMADADALIRLLALSDA